MKKLLIIGIRGPKTDDGILVGGSQKVPYRVFKALSSCKQLDTTFWFFNGPNFEAANSLRNKSISKIHAIPGKLYLKTIFREFSLLLRLKELRGFDLIQVHHPHYALILGVLKKIGLIKSKLIVKAHGTAVPENISQGHRNIRYLIFLLNAHIHKLHDRMALRLADKVLVSSRYQIAEMLKIYHVSLDKISVIYNGYDDEYFDIEKSKKPSNSPKLIVVGRIVEKKNIIYAIELKKHLDSILGQSIPLTIIAGESNAVENKQVYKRLLKEISACRSINLLHNLSEKQLQEELSQHTILLVPSKHYESIPSVIYEGLATHNYVLAPKKWGIPEVLGESLYLEFSLEKDAQTIIEITRNNLNNPVEVANHSYSVLSQKYMELY